MDTKIQYIQLSLLFLVLNPATATAAKWLQSCPTLCDPIDGSPPGSPIPGILQARTLEWVAISFSNAWKWKVKKVKSEVAQSYLTPSDPMDCSLPGSSIHGIFQARVLEWVATAFSILNPRYPKFYFYGWKNFFKKFSFRPSTIVTIVFSRYIYP